ncbi:hypothetical protein EVAR_59169_1 [Eumeta japonica]|uniref:Uncharacterized protein n=1 Tax=Eumeta variegata TaxID=151549 RepID=A0A4C1YYS7_EUMVA|nr:hypothetical protein EVAR_59169_1 [Eumeta japonica]
MFSDQHSQWIPLNLTEASKHRHVNLIAGGDFNAGQHYSLQAKLQMKSCYVMIHSRFICLFLVSAVPITLPPSSAGAGGAGCSRGFLIVYYSLNNKWSIRRNKLASITEA